MWRADLYGLEEVPSHNITYISSSSLAIRAFSRWGPQLCPGLGDAYLVQTSSPLWVAVWICGCELFFFPFDGGSSFLMDKGCSGSTTQLMSLSVRRYVLGSFMCYMQSNFCFEVYLLHRDCAIFLFISGLVVSIPMPGVAETLGPHIST